jgi:hypothetical protein
MVWESKPLRIVRSYPGSGTLDTVYEADDGSLWKTEHWPTSDGATTLPPARRVVKHGFLVLPHSGRGS